MIPLGQLQNVPVTDIELDRENPRIRMFLEMYGEDVTPEQIHLALGAGGDDTGAGSGTTVSKLTNSIPPNDKFTWSTPDSGTPTEKSMQLRADA